jgi:hypothetical protein
MGLDIMIIFPMSIHLKNCSTDIDFCEINEIFICAIFLEMTLGKTLYEFKQ